MLSRNHWGGVGMEELQLGQRIKNLINDKFLIKFLDNCGAKVSVFTCANHSWFVVLECNQHKEQLQQEPNNNNEEELHGDRSYGKCY
jgi:hypothetical protein